MGQSGGFFGARAVRGSFPVLVGGTCLWLIFQQMEGITAASVVDAFGDVTAQQWVLSLIATAISFAAIAQYDVIAHRHLRTGVPDRDARRSGAIAIGLSQSVGLGLVSATAARWRSLPGLPPATALKLTLLVSLLFFPCWAAATAIAASLAWVSGWLALGLLIAVLAALAGVVWAGDGLSRRFPRLPHLPPLPALVTLLGMTVLDTAAAAFALWVLFPGSVALDPAAFFAIYLLALGAALISGTPGGVGPFELILVTHLAGSDPNALAATLMAFRLVYYAIPLVLGAAALLQPRKTTFAHKAPMAAPASGDRAEHALHPQNGACALPVSAAPYLPLPNTLVLFLSSNGSPLPAALKELAVTARRRNKLAAAYKLTEADAARAQASGWATLPIAEEAFLPPGGYTLASPSRRQLRRLLRKAEKAGITVAALTSPDWQALATIDHSWRVAHGGALGTTMGRFDPAHMTGHLLYGAYLDNRLVAFVSVLPHETERALDLMRHETDIPPGTMQALIHHAIEEAQANGIGFSLAAVPAPWLRRIAKQRDGLVRFKTAFAPEWRSLFAAGASHAALALALFDMFRAVHAPPSTNAPHQNDENYEFASPLPPCEATRAYH